MAVLTRQPDKLARISYQGSWRVGDQAGRFEARHDGLCRRTVGGRPLGRGVETAQTSTWALTPPKSDEKCGLDLEKSAGARCAPGPRTVLVALLAASIFVGASSRVLTAQPAQPQANPRPSLDGWVDHAPPAKLPDLKGVGLDQKLNAVVPLDLSFRDEQGHAVQLKDYFNERPVILALVYYTCPMLCGMEMDGIVRSLRVVSLELGSDFQIVAVSINPKETPKIAAAKKAEYQKKLNRPGFSKGWHFLTGDSQNIHRLAQAVGFRYIYNPENQTFSHATGIMILTPQGRMARYLYGVDYAPRDLRLALVDASQNRIGSPVDQFLLYCYHYDPSTGKYTLMIMNILRIASVMTLIAMGLLIFFLLRRERGQKQLGELGTGAR